MWWFVFAFNLNYSRKMQTGLSILIFCKLSSSSGKIHFEQLLYRKRCVFDLKFYIFLIENFCFQYFQALVIAETEANEMLRCDGVSK